MWYWGEQILFQPFAVSQHALLMAARAEVTSLAGIGQQVIVAALITVYAGETSVQVAAGKETLEDCRFDRAFDEIRRPEFLYVLSNASIKRACPRITRVIDATCQWLRFPAHAPEFASLLRWRSGWLPAQLPSSRKTGLLFGIASHSLSGDGLLLRRYVKLFEVGWHDRAFFRFIQLWNPFVGHAVCAVNRVPGRYFCTEEWTDVFPDNFPL